MKKIRNTALHLLKYATPALIISALALFAAAALFRPASSTSAPAAEPESVSESLPVSAPAESAPLPAPGWLLLECSGHAVVYNGENFAFVTDIDLNTLRAADRDLLRLGIAAENLETILMLIEDLGS